MINDLIKTQNKDSYVPMCGVCYHYANFHKSFYKCFKCNNIYEISIMEFFISIVQNATKIFVLITKKSILIITL